MSEEERILSEDKTLARSVALRLLKQGKTSDFLFIVRKYNIPQNKFEFIYLDYGSKINRYDAILELIDKNYCIPDLKIARWFIWDNKFEKFQKLLESNAYKLHRRRNFIK